MTPKKKQSAAKADSKKRDIDQIEQELARAREAQQRALADYQNLVRRNQEERLKFIQMANRDFVEALLQPLEHLSLAAKQINDSGLNMVIDQFWQKLNEMGLEEIDVMGKPFDVVTMEVVGNDGKTQETDNLKVVEVRRPGFRYQGEVIQHAQVVMG